jgi:7-carboxy-7-deazaguanine synthase
MPSLSLPMTGRPPEKVAHVLNVNEQFGPTIQGEGPSAGQLCSFLRLAGCNVKCVWCDIPQSWDWTKYDRAAESHPTSIGAAADLVWGLSDRGKRLVIITGGEPLLQAPALGAVFQRILDDTGVIPRLELETSGTRPLGATEEFWTRIVCSPKIIPSAHAPGGFALDVELLNHPLTITKFVVQDQTDLEAVEAAVERYALAPETVWLMPEGITVKTLDERTPWLMQAAIDRSWNFTTRYQVYGWGDERGH